MDDPYDGRRDERDTGRSRRFAVFGNANLEVTVQVGGFPITYTPNRTLQDGIHPGVSGTAYNVGTALAALDNDVTLCVTVGRDLVGGLVAEQLASQRRVRLVPARVEQQPVTVVLVGADGERVVLNDYRGARGYRHDPQAAAEVMRDCDMVVLPVGGVNTDLVAVAAALGALVACDVHAISGLDGPEQPFCDAADVLFLSHERLPGPAEKFLAPLMRRCSRCQVAVVGCGAGGAMMALRGEPQVEHVPAVPVERVVSSVGAGDALFAAFLDGYQRRLPARTALERAMHFAAATLTHPGGAGGFLTAAQLHQRFPTDGGIG
jgi:acarbose 7IV-phosphotransferase